MDTNTLKLLKIHVRKDYIIPDVYTNPETTQEELEEALTLGATVQQSVQTRRSNSDLQAIQATHTSTLISLQSTYDKKIQTLQETYLQLAKEKSNLEQSIVELTKEAREEERHAIQNELNAIQTRLDTTEQRKRALEESRQQDIRQAQEQTEQLMSRLVQAKQDQLDALQKSFDKLQETIQQQSSEISRLTNTMTARKANVKTKGSDYEEEFRNKLIQTFGLCKGFHLKETRLNSVGHEMDLSMSIEGHTILWELKNYSSQVPKQEVDKFLRDLKENPQATIAVMISKTTDIYGKTHQGPVTTEFLDDKMLIFISRFEELTQHDESSFFRILTSLFRIWWEQERDPNTSTDALDRETLSRELEKIMEDIGKRRLDWRRHKAHLEETSRWIQDFLDESETRLDRILRKIKNTSQTLTADTTPSQIPEGIFRDPDSDSEKERSWINSILKVCTPDPSEEIEVRELVELLAKNHKLSKDTIRSNVMSIVQDEAVKKKGVVKYIRGLKKIQAEYMIRL